MLASWQPERAQSVIQRGRAIAPLNTQLIAAQLSVLAYRGEMESARALFNTSLSLVESPELVFRTMLELEIARGAHANALGLIADHATLSQQVVPVILGYLSSLGFDELTHPFWQAMQAKSESNTMVKLDYLMHLLNRLDWETLMPALEAMAAEHPVQTPDKWQGKDYWIAFRYCYLNWFAGRLDVADSVCERVSRAAIDAPGAVEGATKLLLATRTTYQMPFTPQESARLSATITRYQAKPALSQQDNFELAQWYALDGQITEALAALRKSSEQGLIVPTYQMSMLDKLKITQQPDYARIQPVLVQNAERLKEDNGQRLLAIHALLSQTLEGDR